MSFGLGLEVSTLIAESQKRQRALAGLGQTLDVRRRQGGTRTIGLSLQQRRSMTTTRMGALGMSDSALGLGLVGAGAIAVLAIMILGLWLDYIRFRDGTKWERIMQGVAFLVGLLTLGLAVGGVAQANPKAYGALQLLRAGLDGYAAGHQILRSEHYIANGLALLGDAWGIFDGSRLILGMASQGTVTNVGDGENPYADQVGGEA